MTAPHAPKDPMLNILFDALETVDEGLAVFDADERLVFCNRLYRDYMGPVADMAVPGVDWRKLMRAYIDAGYEAANYSPGEDFDAWADRLRSQRVRRESEVKAGGRIFDVAYTPMRNGGFVLRRKDVTERSRAEAAATHTATLLNSILDSNPIPVVMARVADSKIVWRSPAAVELIGHSEFAIDHFEDPSAREDYVMQLRAYGKVADFRTRCIDRNGNVISVGLSGMLTEYEGETCVVSSITDLTSVLDREALLRKVIEACPAPVLMNRADTGEILYRSPELVALLGESLDAKTFYPDPKLRRGFVEALRENGEVTEYRERLLNAAGEPFWAAVSGRLTEWNGEEALVTFTRDLTQQLAMEAELTRQRELSFQTEKMSALGELLAGVAHELNNPLSVVVGHALMLQEEAADGEMRRQISKISEAAERCARIVKTFQSMARQEPARFSPVNLNDVAKVAADVARYGDDAHSVRIKTALSEDLPMIEGDADQLAQLAINLVMNAEQAITASGTGGMIELATAREDGTVIFAVEDDGPGIPADVRKRVFEPFFTTKGVGGGTGLGLSLCHQIASSHQGTIRVEDAAHGGARFVLELPASGATTQADPSQVSAAAHDDAVQRVLVIDDEEDVAELNAEVLNRAGYETTAVASVGEALALLKDKAFDIVISDLNMPGQSGRVLFETIQSQYPDLVPGVGFITGDTLGRASQTFLAEAGRPYLEKPVSPRELRDFVSQLRPGGTA